MHKLKSILFIIIMLTYCCYAQETELPQHVTSILSNKIAEVLRSMKGKDLRARGGYALTKTTIQFPWLPGYIIKLTVDRIDIAKHIVKPCIEKENLDLLRLPHMYRFAIPPKNQLPSDLHDLYIPEYLCVAEYIEGSQGNKMNIQQVQQMIILLRKSKKTFLDCKKDNIIFTPNGQLALIDTESRGFCENSVLEGLKFLLDNNNFEQDAQQYLNNEIKKYHCNLMIY